MNRLFEMSRTAYQQVVPLWLRLKIRDYRRSMFSRFGAFGRSSVSRTPSVLAVSEISTALKVIFLQPSIPSHQEGLDTHHHSRVVFRFPVISWSFRFQRPQQLLMQFAQDNHPCFYITPQFLGEDRVQVQLVAPNISEVTLPGDPKLMVTRDPFVGKPYTKALAGMIALIETQQIGDAICIVDHPFWYPLVDYLKSKYNWKVIYDCMDDNSGFKDNQQPALANEPFLLSLCDLLVVTSSKLFDNVHNKHPNVLILRNAGDYEHFSLLPDRTQSPLYSLPAPVIGYYGAIAEWFDIDVVAEAAKRYSNWTFALIGETRGINLKRLARHANIVLLGEKSYGELPAYLAGIDVCTIPFRRTPLTEATNPVKIYEYLSAGKPIVARRLPETEAFAGIVWLYDTYTDFQFGIEQAMYQVGKSDVEKRQALARMHTWRIRYRELTHALDKLD